MVLILVCIGVAFVSWAIGWVMGAGGWPFAKW
jgi:hypothetical protein